jgi:hypothetical protein
MHKCNLSIVAAAFGSAVLICAGAFDPAVARITLSQCISNYEACHASCYDPDSALPPGAAEGYCWQRCDDNHAACVDRAMNLSAGASGKSTKPPKNKPGLTPPPTGLMESGPGLSPTGPAATGGKQQRGGSGTLY